jgi:hypothetical protein
MRFRTLLFALTILLIAVVLLPVVGCGVAKDTQLQVKIKDTLKADKNIPADKLIVNVMKGVVTISGQVNTQNEIDKVVEIVKAIPGVVEVKNQMSLPDNWHSTNPSFQDYTIG